MIIYRAILQSAKPNDLAMLVGRDRKYVMARLKPGCKFQTHRGVLAHDNLIGLAWGSQVHSHEGYPFVLLRPSVDDLVRNLRRTSQIVYPKDAGYLLLRLSIGPGVRVIEAGTGSGGLTLVLARSVAPSGTVYSYDLRPEVQRLARKNLEELELASCVEFKLRDIAAGFDERDADAVFLDLREPWEYLPQVHTALAPGGFFGCILPTTNQVSRTVLALEQSGFGVIEVEELLLRPYKAVADRLRPMDRMVAHTGYLLFARCLVV